MDFKGVLRDSGLTKVELAKLYSVSRQTIHGWATGVSPPRPGSYTERMATVITHALTNAVGRKLLPLRAMSKELWAARVEKMAATLQNLKPAPKE